MENSSTCSSNCTRSVVRTRRRCRTHPTRPQHRLPRRQRGQTIAAHLQRADTCGCCQKDGTMRIGISNMRVLGESHLRCSFRASSRSVESCRWQSVHLWLLAVMPPHERHGAMRRTPRRNGPSHTSRHTPAREAACPPPRQRSTSKERRAAGALPDPRSLCCCTQMPGRWHCG